jgi:hypothetical protein
MRMSVGTNCRMWRPKVWSNPLWQGSRTFSAADAI